MVNLGLGRVEVNHNKSVIFWRLVWQAIICLGLTLGRTVEFWGAWQKGHWKDILNQCFLMTLVMYFALCFGVCCWHWAGKHPLDSRFNWKQTLRCALTNYYFITVCWCNFKLAFMGVHFSVKLQAFGKRLSWGMISFMAVILLFLIMSR